MKNIRNMWKKEYKEVWKFYILGDIMAKKILNLTSQKLQAQSIVNLFNSFQREMDKRWEIWKRFSSEQRKKYLEISKADKLNNSKDPIMWLALELKNYLDKWELEK